MTLAMPPGTPFVTDVALSESETPVHIGNDNGVSVQRIFAIQLFMSNLQAGAVAINEEALFKLYCGLYAVFGDMSNYGEVTRDA